MKLSKLILVLIVCLSALTAASQDPVITALSPNGIIAWSHSATSGYYNIEWSSTLTGTWSRSWSGLVGISATSGVKQAAVPMFYRAVWYPTATVQTVSGEIIGIGINGLHAYGGNLARTPVIAGSIAIAGGGFVFNDNGNGTLTGTAGTSGTVVYATGAWGIDLGAFEITQGQFIQASYRYQVDPGTLGLTNNVSGDILEYGVTGNHSYSGTVASTPVVSGSLAITAGGFVFNDNADGTLTGTAGTSGTIAYVTGAWAIDLGALEIATGVPIVGSYSYTNP